MPDTYFELNDDVGIDPDGNPQPLHEIGLSVLVETMQAGEVVAVPAREVLKPIPGTRIFKTDDPRVVAAILGSGLVHETTQPNDAQLRKGRDITQDARNSSGTHADPETPEPGQEA